MVDLLSDALNSIKVAELKGKTTCSVPNSKLIYAVLSTLKDNNYLAGIEKTPRTMIITLNGTVNNCGAVRPRFFVKSAEWEKYETRFLPSKDIGTIIVSTSRGLMTHTQAKANKIGGTILAFVY